MARSRRGGARAADGRLHVAQATLEGLLDATARAVSRHQAPVVGHLFSILPKIGLDESSVDDGSLEHLAAACVAVDAAVEVNEKWSTPSAATVGRLAALGVRLEAGSDAHRASDVGRYRYVADVARGRGGQGARVTTLVQTYAALSTAGTVGMWILTALVMLGAVPLLVSTYQSLLIGLHRFRNHYAAATPYLPRVAILVPAWNEAAVIGRSVDRLMSLDYPPEALRVYVVDDASTDDTPDVCSGEGSASTPTGSFHLRREKGGEGKAHTLNHGLALIMAERRGWRRC